MTLIMRPYIGEQDLALVADLINACEAVDRINEGTSVDELRREFADPRLDQARDLQLWLADDGIAVGFAQLWLTKEGAHPEGFLWFRVHPAWRNGEIEAQIFAWAEVRLREQGQIWDVAQVKLIARARDDQADQLALLEQQGFAVTRFFMTMVRSLDDMLPEPQLPSGFTLRYVAGEDEIPAWVELYNQSFIDHWNHHPLTVEQELHDIRTDPHYRAERDLIAVDTNGTFAAFCFCSINPDENARTGRDEGWINLVGTRRGFRRNGLGRAMLLAGMRQLAAERVSTVLLGVDADSPTGANRLYESVGFSKRHAWVAHSKDVVVTRDQRPGTEASQEK